MRSRERAAEDSHVMSTRRRRAGVGGRARAYTLLELVSVLAILCLLAAMAAPSLRGFGQGRRISECAAQVVALAARARTQAVTEGATYRLHLDPATGTYWLTAWDDARNVYLRPGDDFGRVFEAPEGVTLVWDAPSYPDGQYVEFLPTGRSTPVTIRLTDEAGQVLDVACLSPAESFQVLPVAAATAGGR